MELDQNKETYEDIGTEVVLNWLEVVELPLLNPEYLIKWD